MVYKITKLFSFFTFFLSYFTRFHFVILFCFYDKLSSLPSSPRRMLAFFFLLLYNIQCVVFLNLLENVCKLYFRLYKEAKQ